MMGDIFLALGLLVGICIGGWVLLSLAVIILTVNTSGGLSHFLQSFKRHIISCVAEGKCPATDSPIHRKREVICWFLIRKFGGTGTFAAAVFTFFYITFIAVPGQVVLEQYFRFKGEKPPEELFRRF